MNIKYVLGTAMAMVAFYMAIAASDTTKKTSVPLTPEQMRAKQEAFVNRNGGLVPYPGTPKGRICIIDSQKRLAYTNMVVALSQLEPKLAQWNIGYEVGENPRGNFVEAMRKHNVDVAVFVVDDTTTPSVLSSPDEHWVAMNVGKLGKNLLSDRAMEKFFIPRCQKQLLRSIALACGGAGSTYPNNLMDVTKPEDLDFCGLFIPGDKYDVCERWLNQAGYKAKRMTIYRRACQEGWAPAPTNDVQKAIWDKVHAMPKSPIRIKPETKKVAE